tara:strand:- start:475 stop:969 length:495 start_codon:yes stop_codon:yes gene_type:complete
MIINNRKFNSLVLILFIAFSCNNSKADSSKNFFEESQHDFENAVKDYENCKTDYEALNNHKVTIDVRNGSGKSGLAKKIADYLTEKCYDTYYGNWENFDEYKTRIIIYNNNSYSMTKELQNILDADVELDRKKDSTKTIVDMTLIIGKDYQNLAFYEKLNADNE